MQQPLCAHTLGFFISLPNNSFCFSWTCGLFHSMNFSITSAVALEISRFVQTFVPVHIDTLRHLLSESSDSFILFILFTLFINAFNSYCNPLPSYEYLYTSLLFASSYLTSNSFVSHHGDLARIYPFVPDMRSWPSVFMPSPVFTSADLPPNEKTAFVYASTPFTARIEWNLTSS